jgi:hypothetical protein
MLTATEYRAESQWCVELASKLATQNRELSNTMMVMAQRYNWAARQAEEREIRAVHRPRKTCRAGARWHTTQEAPNIRPHES